MLSGDIAVRTLAEFVCRAGDLYPPGTGRRIDAEDGIRLQQRLRRQRQERIADYRSEVAVSMTFPCLAQERKLQGRIDGIFSEQGHTVVEEYKCCGRLPDAPDPVDMGQLLIYGGLFAHGQLDASSDFQLILRLIYCEPDTDDGRTFERVFSARALLAMLAWSLLCFEARLARHAARTAVRQGWAEALSFPLPKFRPSQQALARRVYQAVRQREHLLVEAPTGSGKTLGILFPAVKAMGEGEQLFFLTSRNAGSRAALTAVAQLDPHREHLSMVEITAKEKICPVEGMPCDASKCRYAAGYFDRIGPAVDEVIAGATATRGDISRIAEQHVVCPFELSLDAARWADLVIGDYNYLLDPVVRLQRFNGHANLHVLIDEAHQLSARAREMLSVRLSRHTVRQARDVDHGLLAKRVASVDRALMKLRRAHGEGWHVAESFDAVDRALKRLLETVAAEEIELAEHPALQTLFFDAHRWLRARTWVDAHRFRNVVQVQERSVTIYMRCLDPGPYIREVLQTHGASVRFSGTLSPLPLYQRMQGFEDAPAERCRSPFGAEQAAVMIVPDVPTYYRQRHHSVDKLIGLLSDLRDAHSGRYLVALPSFKYLDLVVSRFILSHPRLHALAQQPGETAESVEKLLREFAAADEAMLFIVSGGMLGESVDFSDVGLHGVVLVGLGLPPPSLEQELLAEFYEAEQGQAGVSGSRIPSPRWYAVCRRQAG